MLFFAANLFWLSYNVTPPDWDEAGHVMTAMRHHNAIDNFIHQNDFSIKSWRHFAGTLVGINSYVYPPLFHFTASFMLFLTSDDPRISLAMANVLFSGILIFSLYKIGSKIHNEQTGLLSVLLILLYPIIFGLSRLVMIDFALIAMTALSIYFLLYSEEFHNKTYTVLFGISLGLGMLTKPTFLTFIIIPFIYVVSVSVSKMLKSGIKTTQLRAYLLRIMTAVIIGIVVALLWYGPHAKSFLGGLMPLASYNTHADSGTSFFDIKSLSYYLVALVQEQISLPFFALFVFGLFLFGKNVSKEYKVFLLIWLISIYLFIALFPEKEIRRDLGILLPICIISAIGLSDLKKFKKLIIGTIVVCGVLQFLVSTLPRRGYLFDDKYTRYKYTRSWWGGHYYYTFPAGTEDWKMEETLKSLGSQPLKIGIISNDRSINSLTIGYYAQKLHLPFKVIQCCQISDFMEDLHTYDYMIKKSDWTPPSRWLGTKLYKDIETSTNHFQKNIQKFTFSRKVPLPDGSDMLIYKRIW